MRAAGLLGVLVVAKVLVVVGTGLPLSAWSPLALLWQDVLVALVFGLVDRAIGRPALGWMLYAACALYIALNVPVARVLSSPLTWTMMRAAGGPLNDSIAHSLTLANAGSLLLVAAAATGCPWLLGRFQISVRPAAVAAAVVFIGVGPVAASHVDTRGFDRNAITALVSRGLPPVAAAAPGAAWRTSPFGAAAGADLSRYRGSASGQNVIVVVLESTAARYLRPYGAPEDPMPNLTALADRALVFDNAYAVYPESIKELFAVLCSRYPAFHVPAEDLASVPCAPLPTLLGAAGYRTALFHSGRFMYLGMDAVLNHVGFDLLEDAGDIGGHVQSSFGVDEPSTVASMFHWIDSLGSGQRFLLTYLPVAGHHPYATSAPGPFRGGEEIDQYRNALHEGDSALGTLVAGLRARHLDDHTTLVIFGDHGEAFGQHPGNAGHTLFIHDENVKVPYLIVMPGMTRMVRVPAIASVLDTAPTILDLVGLAPSPQQQGTSLLDTHGRMALFFTDYSLGFLGLRDGCWKDIFEVDSGRSTLFDLCRDPNETTDLAAGEAARVRIYRDRLEQWSVAEREAIRSTVSRRPP